MSNANRKVKPQTMDGRRVQKQQATIAQLQQQLQSTSMSVLNMRQMYEAVVQEKTHLNNQLQRANAILTAAVVQSRGKTLRIKEAALSKLDEFVGVDTKSEDGDLILTAISAEEFEAMQEEIEEMSDEQE